MADSNTAPIVSKGDNKAREIRDQRMRDSLVDLLGSKIDSLSKELHEENVTVRDQLEQQTQKVTKERTQQKMLRVTSDFTGDLVSIMKPPLDMFVDGLSEVNKNLKVIDTVLESIFWVEEMATIGIDKLVRLMRGDDLRRTAMDAEERSPLDKIKDFVRDEIEFMTNRVKDTIENMTPNAVKNAVIGTKRLGSLLHVLGVVANALSGGLILKSLKVVKVLGLKFFLFGSLLSMIANTFDLSEGFRNAVKSVKDAFDSPELTNLFIGLGDLGSSLMNLFTGSEPLKERFLNITGQMTKVYGLFGDLFSENSVFLQKLGGFITGLKEDFLNFYQPSEKMRTLINSIYSIFADQIIPAIGYTYHNILKPLAETLVTVLVDTIGPMVKGISDYMKSEGGEDVKSGLAALGDFIMDVLIFLFRDVIPPILNGIGFVVANVLVPIIKIIPEVFENLTPIFKMFKDNIVAVISTIGSVFSGIIEAFTADSFSEFGDGLSKAVRGLIGGLFSIVDNTISGFFSLLTGGDYTEENKVLSGLIPNLFKFIINTVRDVQTTIETMFMTGFNNLTEFVMSLNPVDYIKEAVMELVEAIKNLVPSVSDIKDAVLSSLDSAGGAVSDLFSGWFDDQPEIAASNDNQKRILGQVMRDRSGSPITTIVDNSVRQNVVQGGNQRHTRGTARTTQSKTPMDGVLLGTTVGSF